MMVHMPRVFLSALPIAMLLGLFFWISANSQLFPDPVAIHWSLNGEPDGFASLDSHLTMIIGVMAFVTLIWVAVVYLKPIPQSVRVLFLAIVGVLWLLLFGIFSHTMLIQAGLQDASQARIGSWFLLATLSIPLILIPWILAKPQLEVADRFRVRYWGVPLLSVEFSSISDLAISEVRPRDFGGWGIRYANKTTAFIPSSGQALEMRLESGERILVRTNKAAELVQEIDAKRGRD
jgi:hypothetical protein